MLNIGEKHYQEFIPQERINLTMAALSRNDIKEADRLWNTCPSYIYRARDFEYSSRMINLALLGSSFFEKLVQHYNIIKRADEYIASIEYEFEDLIDSEKILHKVKEARNIQIVRLKSLYQGIIAFCEHSGICSEYFLKTLPIMETCFEIDLLLSTDLEVDDVQVKHSMAYFLEHWPFE
jgi:hypothetical protein